MNPMIVAARNGAMGLLWSAGLATAGQYDQPWSLVESGSNSDVRMESRLAISEVDGKSTRQTRRTDPLTPGKHIITVRYETARGVSHNPTRELQMDLDPCTRYRIVAVYETPVGGNWEPKVYSEPIGECASKFKTAKGAK